MLQTNFKRYETKFRISAEQYAKLRELMQPYTHADEWGESTIQNLYLDTPTYLMTRKSAEHPLYKEKLRLRSYGETTPTDHIFFELKKKYDHVVYKRRTIIAPDDIAHVLHGDFTPTSQIERELMHSCSRYENLAPRFYIAYDRCAFYGNDDPNFRVTFDRNIRYRTDNLCLSNDTHGIKLISDDEYILEVKTAGAIPLWLVRFLSSEKIYKTSFSKVGQAYLREGCPYY